MQTVGIVLNVGRDQTDAFERGFRVMEEPIWDDLHARGELVMATLSRLDISTIGQDGAVQYLLCCTSNRGLWGWLTGRDDTADRWQLARAVHAVLTSDSRFTDVRWYVERGWAAGDESP